MLEPDLSDEEFIGIAREAISFADPAPTHVADFAKLAFEFRDVETVELEPAAALSTARAGTDTESKTAEHAGCRISWQTTDQQLFGVVSSSSSAEVILQTAEGHTTPLELSSSSTFETDEPSSSYRLLVATSDGVRWATPWEHGA